jgi:hypothetical protein
MKNLLYNLDSIEVFYGDVALNSTIQIDERITDAAEALQDNQFNDFEKDQIAGRLDKLVLLNIKIQSELEAQIEKLNAIKGALKHSAMP